MDTYILVKLDVSQVPRAAQEWFERFLEEGLRERISIWIVLERLPQAGLAVFFDHVPDLMVHIPDSSLPYTLTAVNL